MIWSIADVNTDLPSVAPHVPQKKYSPSQYQYIKARVFAFSQVSIIYLGHMSAQGYALLWATAGHNHQAGTQISKDIFYPVLHFEPFVCLVGQIGKFNRFSLRILFKCLITYMQKHKMMIFFGEILNCHPVNCSLGLRTTICHMQIKNGQIWELSLILKTQLYDIWGFIFRGTQHITYLTDFNWCCFYAGHPKLKATFENVNLHCFLPEFVPFLKCV